LASTTEVEGVACHFTVPEKGGFKGWLGLAEQVSDISLACRQIGPIHFKGKMEQGDDMFRQRRSLFFKKMQIVRGCDAKRNVLVYMVYSDKLIDGRRRIRRPRCRSCLGSQRHRGSEMRRVHFSDRNLNDASLRSSGAGRGGPMVQAGPWGRGQPTSTNFCGADTLPLSPRCCDIAPQSLPVLFFSGFCSSIRDPEEPSLPARRSTIGRPVCWPRFCCQHRWCHCPRLPSFVEVGHNAQPPGMVAGRPAESAAAMRRFTESELWRRLLHTRMIKKPHRAGLSSASDRIGRGRPVDTRLVQ